MKRKRLALGLAAATVAATAVLLGGAIGSPSGDPGRQPRTEVAAAQLLNGFSPGDTATYVRQLERSVSAGGRKDAEAMALLGLAYQQRARETGDPSFYPRSERALERAVALGEDDLLATTGLAALAASRHRFRESQALAERALHLNPSSAAPYGLLGDALIELGRYEDAFTAFDRMVALKPNLASYSRVSYARELLGRTNGAIEAMKLAVDAGSAIPENVAWTLVQLGNLYFDTGRLGPAARAYREALARYADYVHAKAALARVEAARGNTDRAVTLYRQAVETVPLPQYAAGLGDALAAAGRDAEAGEAYGLVEVIQRLFQANGVRTDLETALFDLDHDRRLEDALARARVTYAERKSIEAEDVLAWALYKNGRCQEARRHSLRALRLGTKDALKLFHRGMIEDCLGHHAEGRAFLRRALEINPYFSLLYAPVAREALR